jgi:transposase InsO family protein
MPLQIHSKTKLTPEQRKQIYQDRFKNQIRICDLVRKYNVTAPTIYKILRNGRKQDFSIHKSTNQRFRTLEYGLKRLDKIEKSIQERLKKQAKRYNKSYPGEMVHIDTKRLPLLKGQSPKTSSYQYLFVAVDDYSRELFVAIKTDKTQESSSEFLNQIIDEACYDIETLLTDNGTEYKGRKNEHLFCKIASQNNITQRFTKPKTPRTNGKAERVIRTLMEMWHNKYEFKSNQDRLRELKRFVNFYNHTKPHKGIDNMTPTEKLIEYFYPPELYTTL